MINIKLCAFSDEADSSLDGQIAALKRNNIPYMEMRTVDGKNVTTLTIEEAKAIKEKLDANGIKVWSIGSPIGKVDINTDLHDLRNESLKNFDNKGFPTKKEEAWKYTSLNAVLANDFPYKIAFPSKKLSKNPLTSEPVFSNAPIKSPTPARENACS